MSKLVFDEEGLLDEPCLSCDNSYLEDIWNEWCCDEKECPYKTEIKSSDEAENSMNRKENWHLLTESEDKEDEEDGK